MSEVQFIKECLKPMLCQDASDDIAEYILQIHNAEDFSEFMENMVDFTNPEHIDAYQKLTTKLFGENRDRKPEQVAESKITYSNNITYHHGAIKKQNNIPKQNNASKQNNISKQNIPKQNKTKSQPAKEVTILKPTSLKFNTPNSNTNTVKAEPSTSADKSGRKLKFMTFYARDNKPGLKKGRHPCECQAMVHDLINNCLKCGRVICEQEGSGPCFFCGNLVFTKEEKALLDENSKESDKLFNYIMERSESKGWKKALETRDRLLKADQLGDGKNVVHDDQSDYFGLNTWNTPEERRKAEQRQNQFYELTHKKRSQMKISLDLATRTVTLPSPDGIANKDKLMTDVNVLLDRRENRFPKILSSHKADLMKEIFQKLREGNFGKTSSTIQKKSVSPPPTGVALEFTNRIVNSDFLESVDTGKCLSMHQPYASLLVAGIKKHEGRTWSTEHRGRLWIAAAAREPADEDILACETMYRMLYNDDSLVFPRKYPTGCLLGFVFLEDCLPQHEYREEFPNGESDSPYVFICSSPVILPVFYPVQGQHKIFPLDKELHRKARSLVLSSHWS